VLNLIFAHPDVSQTINELNHIPNGTCLHTPIFLHDTIPKFGKSIQVWSDEFSRLTNYEIRNIISQLLSIYKMPGVSLVKILPFDDPVPAYGTPEWNSLRDAVLEHLETL
jgi:hypothetical protein